MEIIRIERDGTTPLEIPAELLCETEAVTMRIGTGERGYQLFLYRCDDGFIARIRVLTTFRDEKPHEVIEIMESRKDVENFLFVFEPGEQIPAPKLESIPIESRSRLVNRLMDIYDPLVHKILAALPADSSEEENVVESPRQSQ